VSASHSPAPIAPIPPAATRRPRPAGRRDRPGSRAADRALFARHRREPDPHTRALIVERFLPLARHLAHRYAGSGEPFEDVFQVACLALVKAVDRFDPDRGVAFSSYATPTVLGEIKRHFRDTGWAVHVPRDLQESGLRAGRAVTELARRLGRRPTVGEVAGFLGRPEEEVLEALEATTATPSSGPRTRSTSRSGTRSATTTSASAPRSGASTCTRSAAI
jgi:RNA polymerase sigma-B factor